jgi:hypothetical protein
MTASAAEIAMPFFSRVGITLGPDGDLALPAAAAAALSSDEGLMAWLSSQSADQDAADGDDDSTIIAPTDDNNLESLDELFAALEAELSPMRS